MSSIECVESMEYNAGVAYAYLIGKRKVAQ